MARKLTDAERVYCAARDLIEANARATVLTLYPHSTDEELREAWDAQKRALAHWESVSAPIARNLP